MRLVFFDQSKGTLSTMILPTHRYDSAKSYRNAFHNFKFMIAYRGLAKIHLQVMYTFASAYLISQTGSYSAI